MVPPRRGAGQRRGGPQFGRKQGWREADRSDLEDGCKVDADLEASRWLGFVFVCLAPVGEVGGQDEGGAGLALATCRPGGPRGCL